MKGILVRKEEIKQSLFTDDMIVYKEKPKKSTKKKKKILELMSELSKITGYKLNIQKKKTVVFLYTSNKHMDIKVKNIIPFTIAQKSEMLRCKSKKTWTGIICLKLHKAD